MTIQRIRIVMGLGLAAVFAAPSGSAAWRNGPDARPPSPPVVLGPRRTSASEPVYRFRSRDDRTAPGRIRFRCSFDSLRLHACASRHSERLAIGAHVLRVRAIDRAGNASRITRVDVVVTPPPLPAAGRVVATIPLRGSPGPMAFGEGSLWVGGTDDAVYRIDPATNRVVARIPTRSGTYPPFVAVGFGSVWVSNFAEDSVWRIDPATNAVVAKIGVGFAPEGIDVAGGLVWVANHHGDRSEPPVFSVSQVDPGTNREVGRVTVPGESKQFRANCCGPQGLAAAAGAVWTGSPRLSAVIRIDLATSAVSTVEVPQACGGLAGDDDAVWVAAGCDLATVARIDPRTSEVAAVIRTDVPADEVALGFGAVWVRTRDGVLRIDRATDTVDAKVATRGPGGMAVGAGSIWVGDGFHDAVRRIEPAP